MNKDIKMKIRMNIKKKLTLKGGDGYSGNPFQPIGGMMSYPRYSNNYRPVFEGELLSNNNGSYNNGSYNVTIDSVVDECGYSILARHFEY